MSEWIPPGSDEAIADGCTCPVLENFHGRGVCHLVMGRSDMSWSYFVSQDCPLHDSRKRALLSMYGDAKCDSESVKMEKWIDERENRG